MKILMIATGYPPYLFSENLCNGKLAMVLMEAGVEVDVISKVDEGPSYGAEWTAPWDMLKPTANIISYKRGNKLVRSADVLYSGLLMGKHFQLGIRWARRAYQKAVKMIKRNHYDAIITRSPNDVAHLVGYYLKKRTGIRWIANWNDPATPIWPGQYKHNFSPEIQEREMQRTAELLAAADINSFPSDSLRQHFIQYFPLLKEKQTAVIPHVGVITSAWPKGESNPADGTLRFLHSGNLSVERNPETTFQALRRLLDDGFTTFEFHIMGHINPYTEGLIEKYGLQDHVKCIGSYQYMEALSKMQSYDVLVLLEARLEKGIFFASKITDYLQTGLPVLAISPVKGFAADMFGGQKGEYLADNEDTESIYRAFCEIVTSWKAGTLSDCASTSLYSKVSPSTVVERLTNLIG